MSLLTTGAGRHVVPSAGGPAVVTYQTFSNTYTGTTTLTFASLAIGTAAADRYVIVVLHERVSSSGDPTAVTVAGQSCTRRVQSTSGNNAWGTEIWTTDAPVTSGTTANVVVTFPATVNSVSVGIYSATGLTSIIPTQTKTASGNFSTPTAMSVDVSADGFIIAGGTNSDTTESSTTSGVTEKYDALDSVPYYDAVGGSVASATAQTISTHFTWVNPTADSRIHHVAAAFR
jgi:hypothetical protein